MNHPGRDCPNRFTAKFKRARLPGGLLRINMYVQGLDYIHWILVNTENGLEVMSVRSQSDTKFAGQA